ncbi:hypothetical protein [Cupriavidus oxalaticus]|uniref:Uncharacterized protein n=1 Tax=Cupriavidus oxalaticus TaxID=96344 RepID=A0A976GBI8_9BURK|nr:hypothetical protein [Cupriavidus oxalaticus]QRQ86243.1 hypothetical protein JTE91_23840 [Cupriavidus oxalaticus]QRQ95430.1 hypothetical protein JTE92_18420 [Cupriavidus oxalaticus]WQD84087.1 hypothetical protein U0036_06130 [Cupriavidus oxalaticus]SPC17401.1 conserved hypothetical protein [Cupriavidus oxalaticus]
MTLAFSTTVINDRLQALTRAIDGGSGPGLLKIYDGTRPATGAAVTTQQLLAMQPFNDPSAGSISGTTLNLSIGASVLASKTGNASWARITDSAGTFVADLDVSASGGSGELQLSAGGTPTTQLYEGGVFSISVATLVEA